MSFLPGVAIWKLACNGGYNLGRRGNVFPGGWRRGQERWREGEREERRGRERGKGGMKFMGERVSWIFFFQRNVHISGQTGAAAGNSPRDDMDQIQVRGARMHIFEAPRSMYID